MCPDGTEIPWQTPDGCTMHCPYGPEDCGPGSKVCPSNDYDWQGCPLPDNCAPVDMPCPEPLMDQNGCTLDVGQNQEYDPATQQFCPGPINPDVIITHIDQAFLSTP